MKAWKVSEHEIVWYTADEINEVKNDRQSVQTSIRAAKD